MLDKYNQKHKVCVEAEEKAEADGTNAYKAKMRRCTDMLGGKLSLSRHKELYWWQKKGLHLLHNHIRS